MKKIVYILLLQLSLWNTYALGQGTTDTITFEEPTSDITILPTNGNLWQIGMPQKTFFDTAYSGLKAILTDTVNSYPPNDTSSFVFTIHNTFINYTCRTCVEFWHKYDMDSIGDKGLIDASYDGGNSWETLAETYNDGAYFHWLDDIHENGSAYTQHPDTIAGKSDGWIHSTFCWQWYIPVKSADTIILMPDSLLIRFTFISDSLIKNKDGWMIDNIIPYAAGWDLCSDINEFNKEMNLSVFPNPFSTQITIQTDILLKNAVVALYNSQGQIMKHIEHISGKEVVILRDELPPGLYFLALSENNKIYATKKLFITEH